jgi:uroporphyrinogen-III decarboxylase
MINRDTTKLTQTLGPDWTALSAVQKREQRFQWWQSSTEKINFINAEAREAYQVRLQRWVDVYHLREPDRVPVAHSLGNIPLILSGVDYADAMHDYARCKAAYEEFNRKFAADLDVFASPARLLPGKVLDMLDYKMYVWAGHGLPSSVNGYQFVEGEYMKAEEYKDLILNPADFWTRTYLPRIFGAFEVFRNLDPVTDFIEVPTTPLMPLASSQFQATLQKLLQAGKELELRNSILQSLSQLGLEAGFPQTASYFCKAPFDILGDTLRGTQGIMKDMYRRPDELLKSMQVLADLEIKSTLAKANSSRSLMANFPLHKGADGWMSQKQFDQFYWPSLKKVIDALIEEGMIVILFAEGSYNTRLESVNQFPKGAVHWWFDQTDMVRAKKILGDKCGLQGNLPSSILMTGTPAEVKEYSRDLIRKCGRGGGYVLSSGAVDADARVENLKAMVDAAKEYGVYRPSPL